MISCLKFKYCYSFINCVTKQIYNYKAQRLQCSVVAENLFYVLDYQTRYKLWNYFNVLFIYIILFTIMLTLLAFSWRIVYSYQILVGWENIFSSLFLFLFYTAEKLNFNNNIFVVSNNVIKRHTTVHST